MAKKYISKIKLPNIADVYDITVPSDSELTVRSVTTKNDTTTTKYDVGSINNNGKILSLPTMSGTLLTNTSNVPEAYLQWGGKNFSSGYGPIDAAMNPALSANRLACIDPKGVTIEQSQDGGATWNAYNVSDSTKVGLFTTSGTVLIKGNNATCNAHSQLRITIDGVDGGIYTQLNKFHIYISSSYSDGIKLKIESYDYNSSKNWHLIQQDIRLTGWPAWNVVNFNMPGSGAFGGTNSSTHQRKIRFTFTHSSISSGHENSGLQVIKIYGYGGAGWTTRSSLGATGTPYTYDYNGNTTFGSNVSVTNRLVAKGVTSNGETVLNGLTRVGAGDDKCIFLGTAGRINGPIQTTTLVGVFDNVSTFGSTGYVTNIRSKGNPLINGKDVLSNLISYEEIK